MHRATAGVSPASSGKKQNNGSVTLQVKLNSITLVVLEAPQEDMAHTQLYPQDSEGDQGDSREPPLCGEEERNDHQKKDGDQVLVQ